MTMAPNEPTEVDTPLAPPRRSLLGRLLVAVGVAAVIGIECLVACLCVPSAEDTAAMAAGIVKSDLAEKGENGKTAHGESKEEPENVELDLGEFCVTAFQPASNTTLRIDFHLFGIVKSEAKTEFNELLERNRQRFREQVLMTVRSAAMSDLADPSLGLIKRTILDKTRRTLGKSLLRDVVISDYSFVEQ